MTDCTKSRAYRHFIQHAPRMPRATNRLGQDAPLMRKRDALSRANVQIQPAEMRFSIAVDIDNPATTAHIRELDFPPPQLLMINPANGHGHGIWQLAEGVPFGERAQRRPQLAFLDLQRQIRIHAEGDAGYGHYMVKTPGHEQWQTIINDLPPYRMAELFEAIPAGVARQARQKRVIAEGEGRHQTIFEIGRRWAYGAVKQAKRRGSQSDWEAQVLAEFMALNAFTEPLGTNQVQSLARNVARYCWNNAERLNGGVLDGEKRSLLKSWQRDEITADEARERMVQGARYSHAVRRNTTDDAVLKAIEELTAAGVKRIGSRRIAEHAELSRNTVRAALGRLGAANAGGN